MKMLLVVLHVTHFSHAGAAVRITLSFSIHCMLEGRYVCLKNAPGLVPRCLFPSCRFVYEENPSCLIKIILEGGGAGISTDLMKLYIYIVTISATSVFLRTSTPPRQVGYLPPSPQLLWYGHRDLSFCAREAVEAVTRTTTPTHVWPVD